ncbi:MAG: hypothetical protein ACR2PJ_01465 [Pseudomonadales bacterium]
MSSVEQDNSKRSLEGMETGMRGLSPDFIDELRTGFLNPILERVQKDDSLCLEIRENYVNIYYRGGNLLKISVGPQSYLAFFDSNYAKGDDAFARELPPDEIGNESAAESWLNTMPKMKYAMDLYMGKNRKEEREAQQLIVRENNFGGVSRATDYFVCDIEYAHQQDRFDIVAVHWPSRTAIRKKQDGRRLVFVEAKHGDGAIDGSSGIHSHIVGINQFLDDDANVQALKKEMVNVFNQKLRLGLLNSRKDLLSFSDEPPMLLLALVNHDPDKLPLHRILESLPPSPNAEIYLATGCFMGYGLFDQAVVPLDEARLRFGSYILS